MRLENWNCYIQSSGRPTARLWHNKSNVYLPRLPFILATL